MPSGDRTGPWGAGPMTGRAAGYCAGYATPGYANPGNAGVGYGRGRGRGAGWGLGRQFRGGRGFSPQFVPMPYAYPQPQMPAAPMAPIDKNTEINFLKDQVEQYKGAMEQLQKRLDELAAAKGE